MIDLYSMLWDCYSQVIDAGITPGTIKRISVNNRFKATWGRCTMRTWYGGRTEFEIEISGELVRDNKIDGIRNTIIHEILHTVDNCHGHDGEWKRCADIMNKKYGYNIKSHSGYKDKGYTDEQLEVIKLRQRSKYKYIVSCEKCDNQWKRQRKCGLVNSPSKYRCPCGGELRVRNI